MRLTGADVHAAGPRRDPPPNRRSFDEALERTAVPSPASAGQRPAALALPELREAVRAIPPAIWAGQVGAARAVELSFGRDLTVEIRQAAGGVALEVRASHALARAAKVDLPALVEALRARGVAVVRAEVRGGSRAGTGRKGP